MRSASSRSASGLACVDVDLVVDVVVVVDASGSAGVTARLRLTVVAGAGSTAARAGAAASGVGPVAGSVAGACASASAVASARPFMARGAYASFDAMASVPREAFGDLATTAFVDSSILFRSLEPDERRDLLQVAQLVTYSAGELISDEGDDVFFIVRDGSATVLGQGAAGPVELYRLERGALFGVGRALGSARAARLEALTEVTVVAFPAQVVGVLAERFPKVKKLLQAVQTARDKEAASRPPS